MIIENKEVEKAVKHLTTEYLNSLIELLNYEPSIEELNVFNMEIFTDDKAKYELNISHIDGSKIKFDKLKSKPNKECDTCGCIQSTHGCNDLECRWVNKI